ncbi:hypothetical protein AB0I30_11380 [Nocardia tengchongensis]|uniref:hypothetical protein n=1 Tax=Nocardia tengchongensis TaxID=2055889 RepID=UPI0033C90574
MSTAEYGDFADQLRLDEGEAFLLSSFRVLMLDQDLESDKRRNSVKTATLDAEVEAATELLDYLSDSAPVWIKEFSETYGKSNTAAVFEAPTRLGGHLAGRPRAVLLMVELLLLHPWNEPKTEWVKDTRLRSLRTAASLLPHLREDDLTIMEREHAAILRRLRRSSVKWGRVALVTAAGLGLGVVTAGWAAPAIGAAIGGTMGLSGAAATSAGLAALGGGSLASGGLGMAGGTALLTGLGGAVGATAGAAGARWTQLSAAQIITDAIKLDLYVRMVHSDDDELARRVVVSLQQRITELAEKTNQLAEQLREVSADRTRLAEENKQLRDQLKREHAESQLAESALEIVIDRLSGQLVPQDADAL